MSFVLTGRVLALIVSFIIICKCTNGVSKVHKGAHFMNKGDYVKEIDYYIKLK